MDDKVSKELEKILRDTTRLSFSMFANEDKKREQLSIIKQRLEGKILAMLSPDDHDKLKAGMANLWETAEKSACGEFETLPERLRLNSFYLQEVMHQYVGMIISLLSE